MCCNKRQPTTNKTTTNVVDNTNNKKDEVNDDNDNNNNNNNRSISSVLSVVSASSITSTITGIFFPSSSVVTKKSIMSKSNNNNNNSITNESCISTGTLINKSKEKKFNNNNENSNNKKNDNDNSMIFMNSSQEFWNAMTQLITCYYVLYQGYCYITIIMLESQSLQSQSHSQSQHQHQQQQQSIKEMEDVYMRLVCIMFAAGIHTPFSVIYHLRLSMGWDSDPIHNNIWRKLDQAFINVACIFYAYAISGHLWWGGFTLVFKMDHIVDLWRLTSTAFSRRFHITLGILCYVFPILIFHYDWITFLQACISCSLSCMCFVMNQKWFRGYGSAVFHLLMIPFHYVLLGFIFEHGFVHNNNNYYYNNEGS